MRKRAEKDKVAGKRAKSAPIVGLLWICLSICVLAAPTAAVATATAAIGKDKDKNKGGKGKQSIPPIVPARWSQLTDTLFYNYTLENGLPNGTVTSLAEDGDGFLWVGTQAGLARWDGYRFHLYQPNPEDPGALPDNYIQTLHTDRLGRLWVGTSGNGLARYDRLHDRFISTPAGPAGLSHVAITAIADDQKNGVWVGTELGLDHLNPDTGVVTQVRQVPGMKGGFPSSRIRVLLAEPDGSLWVGTDSGLVLRAPGTKKFVPIVLPMANEQAPDIAALRRGSDGRVWIGTAKHGAFVLDQKRGVVQAVFETDPSGSPLSGEWVNSITEVRPGEIWFGTYGYGIVSLDTGSMQTRRIRNDPLLSSSVANNTVWFLHKGRGGLIWVGTERGLGRHDPNQTGILTLFGASNKKNGISDLDVPVILPVPDGNIWLGLRQGADVINPVGRRVAGLRPDPTQVESALPKSSVSALASTNGTIYLGTGRGVYRTDQAAHRVQRLTMPPRNPSDSALVFFPEGKRLWIGTVEGLWLANLSDANVLPVSRPLGAEQLTDQRVGVIAPASGGALWIGTSNGLNLFDHKTHAVERIFPNPTDPHGLASGLISSLLTDRQGRLWVGTLGGGINLLDSRDAKGLPRFLRLGTAQGLPSANINKLLEDKNGDIWASSDDGIVKIDHKTLAVRALRRADGVAISEYWVNSGAVTPEGELLFGGTGGLTVVRPNQLKDWNYRPPVVITDVRVMGKPVEANRFNGAGSKSPLIIKPDANNFAVEFSSLDYSAPERNRYAYRLDGYDKDWNDTDPSRRLAAYTNLPPGDYRLRLRGSNRNGVWSEPELLLPIRVLPAWYQTWWCSLLEVLAVLLAVFALVQARTKYLRLRHRELENQVWLRTAALNHANADLALSVDTLRQLSDVGRDITGNLDAGMVFEALYRHVGGLLDAPGMSIYLMNASGSALIMSLEREDGENLPGRGEIPLDSPSSHAALAARERQEQLFEFEVAEKHPEHVPGTRFMFSALFAPLIVDERVLGVMSIQSDRHRAYGERERLIFRTLCAYGAIALANVQALAALHQAQAQLAQQEKLASLGGLVAGVAHEINTPLGTALMALSGASAVLQRLQQNIADESSRKADLTADAEEGAEYVALALQTAARAAELVTSFKAIAVRFDGDRGDDVNLADYFREIVALACQDLQSRGCQIEIAVAPGLTVHIVPAALTEALSKVLANVQDHAFADGRSGTVKLSAQVAADQCVEIVVADDGQGIAPEDVPKVFDPFFTTQSGSGGHVGLGLHIAYNHVTQRLKGKIGIVSALGKGTTVTIRLAAGAWRM